MLLLNNRYPIEKFGNMSKNIHSSVLATSARPSWGIVNISVGVNVA
jgi:hypothetical protein